MEEIIWSEYEGGGEKALEKLTLPKLQRLKLMELPALKSIYSGSTTVLICDSIIEIEISECREIECVFWRGFNPLLTLEYLQLQSLENLKSVFDKEALGLLALENLTLPKLQRLKLVYLPALKSIYSSSTTVLICDVIKEIKISHCPKIESVFWRGFNPLPTLEDLQLVDLKNLKSVFDEETLGLSALEKITLPKLQRLELSILPALKSIYSGSTTVLICDSIRKIKISWCQEIESVFWRGFNPLPTLEYLQLSGLGNLKSVFDEEALGLSAPPATYFSLKTINVYGCHKLKKVFSSERLLGCFQSLELIAVSDCDQMEELISPSTYEEIEAPEKITLPNLHTLALKRLPELKSICCSSNVLICDSIKSEDYLQ